MAVGETFLNIEKECRSVVSRNKMTQIFKILYFGQLIYSQEHRLILTLQSNKLYSWELTVRNIAGILKTGYFFITLLCYFLS